MTFAKIGAAIAAFRRGEFLVVVDDAEREDEGDLIIAAEHARPEAIAFMVRHTTGIVCTALDGERIDALALPPMVQDNTESQRTAFTVSVDLRAGTSTGVSAKDRSATIRALAHPDTQPDDLARPGHVFPLRARHGGVLARPGHTEAAVDLARLAGLRPAGALCELVSDDGSMMRLPQLRAFALEHELPIVRIADLIAYRQRTEILVERVAEARLPTPYGDFAAYVFRSLLDGREHVALVRGDVAGRGDALVRVHSECLTGEAFSSRRCDCGEQLDASLAQIARAGCGAVVYLRGHEGRGIGLAAKLRAYALQDAGRDTVDANLELGLPDDARDYSAAAYILRQLGVFGVRLLSNNPRKIEGLERCGVQVLERRPLLVRPTVDSLPYLRAKQLRLGHLLDVDAQLVQARLRASRALGVEVAAEAAVEKQDVVLHAHTPLFARALPRRPVD